MNTDIRRNIFCVIMSSEVQYSVCPLTIRQIHILFCYYHWQIKNLVESSLF